MGGQDGLSAFRKHPGRKAINAKRVAAPPGFTSSRERSAATIFAVQSSIRPLEEHEHLRPGFRNHTHSFLKLECFTALTRSRTKTSKPAPALDTIVFSAASTN